jgi:hypothetical protein
MSDPVSNGPIDGRDGAGRFKLGNPGGPGNPQLAILNRHRAAMLKGVRDRDIKRAMRTMIEIMDDEAAKASDRLTAAKLLLDRVLGTPAQTDVLERIEKLEGIMAQRKDENAL